MHCIDIAKKTIVPIFYSQWEQVKKNSFTKKLEPDLKKSPPYMCVIAYLPSKACCAEKIFGLAGYGVGSISRPSKSSRGRKKNQDQTHQLVNPLKIRRFHGVLKDLAKWIPNFPISPRKLVSIFYKNKILIEG